VRRHQGNASAEILRHWIRRQPDGFWMFHDAAGEVIGFVCMLEVASATEEDGQRDPAIAAARSYAAHFAPPRPGEQVLYSRWGLSRSAAMPSDTPGVWELICTVNVTQWFGAPRLSWSFVAVEDADRWTPFFSHIRQDRASRADFSVGGRTYAVFAHDWRAEPPVTWLREMAERELTTTPSDKDDLETQTPMSCCRIPSSRRLFGKPCATMRGRTGWPGMRCCPRAWSSIETKTSPRLKPSVSWSGSVQKN
jgi:hypothetical protein